MLPVRFAAFLPLTVDGADMNAEVVNSPLLRPSVAERTPTVKAPSPLIAASGCYGNEIIR